MTNCLINLSSSIHPQATVAQWAASYNTPESGVEEIARMECAGQILTLIVELCGCRTVVTEEMSEDLEQAIPVLIESIPEVRTGASLFSLWGSH